MERIRNLDRYQKAVLLILCVMLVVFTALYSVVSRRVGFAYEDAILVPREENGGTVYTGTIRGETACFTVTADQTVTFQCGDTCYGPYTAVEDPSAIPAENSMAVYMTGVEIRQGEEIFFRGGVIQSGDSRYLVDESGQHDIQVYAYLSDGTMVDGDGNVVDHMAPSASTILSLMEGPVLTSKGVWLCWFGGVFLSVLTALTILFAEELFRWNMSFHIRDYDRAEPSDWEMAQRYISWTLCPLVALAGYIMGLVTMK